MASFMTKQKLLFTILMSGAFFITAVFPQTASAETYKKYGNNNSRSCYDWCASPTLGDIKGITGKCLSAKAQGTDNNGKKFWMDISCGGGPAGEMDVECTCEREGPFIKTGNNNSRSCHDWCQSPTLGYPHGFSGSCMSARAKGTDNHGNKFWMDISCGGGPAGEMDVECTCN